MGKVICFTLNKNRTNLSSLTYHTPPYPHQPLPLPAPPPFLLLYCPPQTFSRALLVNMYPLHTQLYIMVLHPFVTSIDKYKNVPPFLPLLYFQLRNIKKKGLIKGATGKVRRLSAASKVHLSNSEQSQKHPKLMPLTQYSSLLAQVL